MSPDEAKQVEESIALAEAIARRRALDEAERACRMMAHHHRLDHPCARGASYCADAIAALKETP